MDIDALQKRLQPLFPGLMGVQLTELAADRVVATLRVLHRGRTTMVWQTSIRNAEGKLCSVVTQTQLVLD